MLTKAFCPYCGAEMKRGDYVVHVCYVCPECEAEGPLVTERYGETVDETWERAKQAAMRRADPQNHVLTLEEVVEICKNPYMVPIWIESEIHMLNRYYGYEFMSTFLRSDYVIENYNETWRCWLRKPTDEERQNTQWEVQNG